VSWWKFWERTTEPKKPRTLPENWRELPDHEKFDLIAKFGCLVCESNPEFLTYEGPSGGMSQNMWCATCGTRWNMAVMPGPGRQTAGIAELVTEREREIEFKDRDDG
jgi:hypothetical protein